MADTLAVTEGAHSPGLCDLAYLQLNGGVQLVTCGADKRLCFR